MAKLKLQLDQLRVDTFHVASDDDGGAGTILGHIKPDPALPATIEPCIIPTQTCGASCYASCGGSCASCYNTCQGSCPGSYTCGQSCNPLARCIPPAQPIDPLA
jgi:hypothetical protein